MVRAVPTMVILEGHESAFEAAWETAARQASEMPGCIGQTLTCDPKDPRTYIITGDWQSDKALNSFEESQVRKSLSKAVEPLRESAAKTVLDIIARF